jgi:hypothetical protein
MAATPDESDAPDAAVQAVARVYGGVEVRGRVLAIRSQRGTRHEIALESGGHRAVIDVPRDRDPATLIDCAMSTFAGSMAARP